MRLRVGTVGAVVAFGPLAFVVTWIALANLGGVKASAALVPGPQKSPFFTSHIATSNLLSLEIDRWDGEQRFLREQCLLGIRHPWIEHDECKDTDQLVDFDWEALSRDGAILARGSYKPLGWSGTRVYLGRFRTKFFEKYQIILQVYKDGGDLKLAHPRLVVQGETDGERLYGLALCSLMWAGFVALTVTLVSLTPLTDKFSKWRC
jgi:hypothetical protein